MVAPYQNSAISIFEFFPTIAVKQFCNFVKVFFITIYVNIMEASSELPRITIGNINDSSFLDDKSPHPTPVIPPRYHPLRSTSLVHDKTINEFYSKRQISSGPYLYPPQHNTPLGLTSPTFGLGTAAADPYLCVNQAELYQAYPAPFQPPFYNVKTPNVPTSGGASDNINSLNPRKAPNMNFREKITRWLETISDTNEVIVNDTSFSSSNSDVDIDIEDLEDRLQAQAEKLTRFATRQYRYDSEPVALFEGEYVNEEEGSDYADDSYQVLNY
ncbi:uncharacterized protein SPAPADRAFT_48449 [Spathaspora passalidarum NRRL Y-27907]|uniref:Uncharacterized protein n=1 Tax=Spathaspora passalidarum (strain NRRL Y-27907 / 11-Y1) TaxID=619300 RepID=G3AH28_SPAPN|nr:uncharacterized protein SPAPADRAFT_48449 [Spathaspora passalidarum NRRL Y-27907]EGW35458.1 hypothetical protein SPAPADRAFT_48449 [Spathaspora passalidarum NRRL Y-27907]